jgi:IS30 family transposase
MKNLKRQPLTYEERKIIEVLKVERKGLREIGRILDRDHTVIKRETERNSGNYFPYSADKAQLLSEQRLLGKKKTMVEENLELKKYVLQKLRKDWSPEQISGCLREEEYKPPGQISHETIYQYVYSVEGRQAKLYRHLRTGKIKRNKSGGRNAQKTKIPERVSIHERPEIANNRSRYGDWETDTIESKRNGKNHLSVQYERKSQLCRMNRIINKTSEETKEAIMKTIDSLPLYLFHTLTYDNGTEGVDHVKIREEFDIETYFCDPYKSWQKGGVENCNKLIRQYFPKGTDFSKVTDEEIYTVQEKLNNRPRKKLNYKTPNQIIKEQIEGATVF